MATSAEEHNHSSCNPLFEQLLRPFLKCLGYEEASSTLAPMHHQQQQAIDPLPPPEAENQMKVKEDEEVLAMKSIPRRRPAKPKIGSGGGPKINSSSSS